MIPMFLLRVLLTAAPVAALATAAGYIIYPQVQAALHPALPPMSAHIVAPMPATQADILGLKQQIAMWQAQNQQFADEVARSYSVLSVTSTAIHNDLLRAEAERAAARAQAQAVDQRYRNDAKAFLQAVPK